MEKEEIKSQFNKIDPKDIQNELKEYGAWTKEELTDINQNKKRILWIAAGNLKEDNH